jgi:hypothetical protein
MEFPHSPRLNSPNSPQPQNRPERIGVDDVSRADRALKGADGKRPTYQILND